MVLADRRRACAAGRPVVEAVTARLAAAAASPPGRIAGIFSANGRLRSGRFTG
jgi:hypothetical protein